MLDDHQQKNFNKLYCSCFPMLPGSLSLESLGNGYKPPKNKLVAHLFNGFHLNDHCHSGFIFRRLLCCNERLHRFYAMFTPIPMFHSDCRVVPIGEASVIIAVSSAHRKNSLEAVQYCIDTLKATVPIWKKVETLDFLMSF